MTQPIFILSIFSTILILLPFTFAIIYLIKKGIYFDHKADLIMIYISVTIILHAWAIYLAFNSTNNLFLFRAMNFIDTLFLGLFLLTFAFSSTITRIIITLLLLSVTYLIDKYLGVAATSPNEQATAVSIILIWLVLLASKKINYSDERGKSYSYFLLAIAVGAINNLSIIFSELSPELFALIISISNIACYIFYSIGFYILIKKIEP